MDFAGPYHDKMWLIVVDAYSKWIEVVDMRKCTSTAATIKELRMIFSRFGLPRVLVSDNGSNLVSAEMKEFLESNGIRHVPVPTYSPASNGLAENGVRNFKVSMDKACREEKDIHLNLARWLLQQRNTPHSTTGQTPAELMLGRPTRTLLSLLDPVVNSRRKVYPQEEKVCKEFKPGDKVRILEVRTGEWYLGKVLQREGCKVYVLKTERGIERRHVDHLVRAWGPAILNPTPELEHDHNPVPELKQVAPNIEPDMPPDRFNSRPNTVVDKQPAVFNKPINKPVVAPVPDLRRSSRDKSAVQRLEYNKLGG